MQNNRKSNQIVERPIRDILGLRDVTLSRNVKKAFAEGVELHSTRETLTVSFERLMSHLFLVVVSEINRYNFVIAVSCISLA